MHSPSTNGVFKRFGRPIALTTKGLLESPKPLYGWRVCPEPRGSLTFRPTSSAEVRRDFVAGVFPTPHEPLDFNEQMMGGWSDYYETLTVAEPTVTVWSPTTGKPPTSSSGTLIASKNKSKRYATPAFLCSCWGSNDRKQVAT